MNTMRFWTGTLVPSAACGLVILATAPGYQIGWAGQVHGRVSYQGHPLVWAMVAYVSEDRDRCDDCVAYTDNDGHYVMGSDWRREGPGRTRFRIYVVPDPGRPLPSPTSADSRENRRHAETVDEVRLLSEGKAIHSKVVSASTGSGSLGAPSRGVVPVQGTTRRFSNPFTTDLAVRLGSEPARIDIDLKD